MGLTKHRLPMIAPMIQAIRREIEQPGTGKTKTRRIMRVQPEKWQTARHGKGQPDGTLQELWGWNAPDGRFIDEVHYEWPSVLTDYAPIQPGDLLAFTETFAFGTGYDELPPRDVPECPYIGVWYRAGEDVLASDVNRGRWRPARFMPYWCSRYTGVVTDVRLERLQEISAVDALAEGPPDISGLNPQVWFVNLWNSLHGLDAWSRNDWVWVYTFRPIAANVLHVELDPAAYGLGEAP